MLVLHFFFQEKKKTFKVELVYLGLVPPVLLIYKSSSFVLVQLHQTKENIGWQVFHEPTCNVCELHLNTHILQGRGPFCKQYLGAADLACRGKKTLTSGQLNTPVLHDFGICALRKSCQVLDSERCRGAWQMALICAAAPRVNAFSCIKCVSCFSAFVGSNLSMWLPTVSAHNKQGGWCRSENKQGFTSHFYLML